MLLTVVLVTLPKALLPVKVYFADVSPTEVDIIRPLAEVIVK